MQIFKPGAGSRKTTHTQEQRCPGPCLKAQSTQNNDSHTASGDEKKNLDMKDHRRLQPECGSIPPPEMSCGRGGRPGLWPAKPGAKPAGAAVPELHRRPSPALPANRYCCYATLQKAAPASQQFSQGTLPACLYAFQVNTTARPGPKADPLFFHGMFSIIDMTSPSLIFFRHAIIRAHPEQTEEPHIWFDTKNLNVVSIFQIHHCGMWRGKLSEQAQARASLRRNTK